MHNSFLVLHPFCLSHTDQITLTYHKQNQQVKQDLGKKNEIVWQFYINFVSSLKYNLKGIIYNLVGEKKKK